MAFCKKCGSVLLEGATFCGKCGTRIDEPLKKLCPNCKTELAPNMAFCSKCGARVDIAPIPNTNTAYQPPKIRTLSISRESQFQCMGNTYKVIVNGNDLGNISIGKTISTNLSSENATLEIVSTTIMINQKLRLVLQLGENPKVHFKIQWPGSILATVQDANILEQST